MSLTQAELKDFEQHADNWFAENKPKRPDFILPETFMEVGSDQQFHYLRDWQAKVYEAGYVGMAWPKEYGGGGKSRACKISRQKSWRNTGCRFCRIPLG